MAAAVSRRIGRITAERSALFLCDMQEKFRSSIQYFPQIVAVSNRMLRGALALKIPIIVTEQYPRGLGRTVPELDVTNCEVFEKTKFSMFVPEVEKHLKNFTDLRSIMLCGVETQACILQTVQDLLEKDYDVHVVADAVSSRTMVDRMIAIERMKSMGAHITTSESLLFMLMKDATHPKFKEIQKIAWDPAPDSGLLGNR